MDLKNSVFISKFIFNNIPINYDYSETINELEEDELEYYLEINLDEFKLLKKKLKLNKNKEIYVQNERHDLKQEQELMLFYIITKDEDIFNFKFKGRNIIKFRSYIYNSFIARFRIWLD